MWLSPNILALGKKQINLLLRSTYSYICRMNYIKSRLSAMSYRTGLIVAIICLACYIISFAQMLLPISVAAKGALWATFYGLAKATQYTAILILGKTGIDKLRALLRRNK